MTTAASPEKVQLVTPPSLRTLQEVAAMTRLPIPTLRYYRATNRGPKFALIGGRLMAREADVLAWIDAQFDTEAAG